MPFVKKLVYSEPTVDYRNYAIDVRGRLINDICEMERVMDKYIAEHFCASREKVSELMEVIICTKFMTFQGKAEIAQAILERRKDATKKEAAHIYTSLVGTIANKRNILAHYSLDTSVGAVKKFQKDETLTFVKYYHVKELESLSKKDVRELIELVFNVSCGDLPGAVYTSNLSLANAGINISDDDAEKLFTTIAAEILFAFNKVKQ